MYGLKLSYFKVITMSVLLCATLCLTGDFDSQLQCILHEQMLSSQESAEIITQVLDDVQRTLNQRWKGIKLTPYGSSTMGLSDKTSDLDLSLEVRNINCSAVTYMLQEANTLFMERPALYSGVSVVHTPKLMLIKLFHIPSQRNVDLNFSKGLKEVSNSKVVEYYLHLDKRFQLFAAFLKFWFKIHELTGHGLGTRTLPNHGMYLLIIFYLQQKHMAPPIYVLQLDLKDHIRSHNWDVGFNELPHRSENTDSLHQMLGGFFKYYSEFNFEQYIVSPLTGRLIPKKTFIYIHNFSKEYTFNTTRTNQLNIRNDLNISTDVYIQDVFFHDINVAKRLSHELASKFKYLLKSAATMFEDMPRDSVLRAIIDMNQHKKTVISHNNC